MRSPLPLALLGCVAVAVIAAFAWLAVRDRAASPPGASTLAAAPAPDAAPEAAPSPGADAAQPPDVGPGFDPAADGIAWTNIDLEDIRSALPDNTYWQMAMPTDDARVLEARDEERARWNEAYGKVLSGTASEAEIEAYYDHRHRVSSDYVEFTKYVLAEYGDELPPRDVGLLQLAQRLHLARLAELPKQVERAHQRKAEQDAAREAWLRQEEAFADDE